MQANIGTLTEGVSKILCPIDGSRCADNALDQAVFLAKAFNGSLVVLSVIDYYAETTPLRLEEKLEEQAKVMLDAAEAKAKKENVACKTILGKFGRPDEAIVKEAKERDIDLIVMGSRGKSGLERLLVGSVTERVIGDAPCPVLVVPAE
jgi:nucleotide-binding universal stress UspA family protein